MTIIDVQGGRYVPQSTPTGKVLWVDSEKGNDSVARRGFMTVPFLTLAAAKDAASSGDTIVVLPGSYSTSAQLAKAGVNWHFLNGAVVTTNTASLSLFQVNSAMTFRVTGAGLFSTGGGDHILDVSHSSADVYFQAWRLAAAKSAVKVTSSTSVVVDADLVLGDESAAVDISGGTTFVRARQIQSEQLHAVHVHGGTLDVDGFQIKSNGGKGILFDSGTARIRAFEVLATTAPAVVYTYSGTLTIQNSRLVSTWNNSGGYALQVTGGTSGIKLHSCVLISHTSASYSITSSTANFPLQFHGMCTGNKPTNNLQGPTLALSWWAFNDGTGIT